MGRTTVSHCPSCHAEYRQGISECSHCHVSLVSGTEHEWEVEGFGFLEETLILQGLRQGWLTLDDRVRRAGQDWGRIKVRLRSYFPFSELIDPGSAFEKRYSRYGAGLGVALGTIATLSWFGRGLTDLMLFAFYGGAIGWCAGEWIGGRVAPYKTQDHLPTSRQPVPDWVKSELHRQERKNLPEEPSEVPDEADSEGATDSFSSPKAIRSQEEFDQFLMTYYQSGSSRQVPQALHYVLHEGPDVMRESSAPLTVYFFARVAQTDPSLLREYERQLTGLPNQGVPLLLQVLQLAGDEMTRKVLESCLEDPLYSQHYALISEALQSGFPRFQNALLRPVRDGLDLDLLWVEFMVTGNQVAVVKIIEVLDWTDLLRQRLQEWLNSEATGWMGNQRRRRKMAQLEKLAGVLYDPNQNKVAGVDDLDTWCFLEGVNQDPDRAKQIREALPFY